MISAIVVDDQPMLLDNICRKIEKCDPDFHILSRHTNALQALDAIKATRPQAIFVDIYMPMMDGLTLIKSAASADYRPRSVIISGHDEFEAARQAISLGVTNYLLKPLKTEELSKVLTELKAQIYQDTEKMQRDMVRSAVMYNHIDPGYPSVINYNCYQLYDVCFGHCLEKATENLNAVDLSQYEKRIADLIVSRCAPGDAVWQLRSLPYNEMILVRGYQDHPAEDYKTFQNTLARAFSDVADAVTISCSDIIKHFENLGTEFQNVRRQLYRNLIYDRGSCICRDSRPTRSSRDLLNALDVQEIIRFVSGGQKKQFLEELHQLLSVCERQAETQYSLQEKICHMGELCSICSPIRFDGDPDTQSYLINTIANASDYKELTRNLDLFFSHYFSVQEQVSDTADIVQMLCNYMETNYSSQISLNTLSELVNLHPTYLGKIFRETTGQTPIDYLIKIRMTKACELLSSTSIKIKEIASQCGYPDQFYFSKAFKDFTGQSPAKFRRNFLTVQ